MARSDPLSSNRLRAEKPTQEPTSASRISTRGSANRIDLTATSPQKLVEELLALFRSPDYDPPLLPAAALELLQLSKKHDATFSEIVLVLERDPLIAAKVLRVVQSPQYAKVGAPIQSLQQALIRLGLETVTQVFLEVSLTMQVFRAPGYEVPMSALRRHSVATAHMTRLICRRASLFDDFGFLCGLLHDVGMAACLIVLGTSRRGTAPPPFEREWPVVLELHEHASWVLSTCWDLPQDLRTIVQHHHTLSSDPRYHAMSAAVCLADWVASRAGFGVGDEAVSRPPDAVLSALHFTESDLTQLEAQAPTMLAPMK